MPRRLSRQRRRFASSFMEMMLMDNGRRGMEE
jgi:hypothetical protein